VHGFIEFYVEFYPGGYVGQGQTGGEESFSSGKDGYVVSQDQNKQSGDHA